MSTFSSALLNEMSTWLIDEVLEQCSRIDGDGEVYFIAMISRYEKIFDILNRLYEERKKFKMIVEMTAVNAFFLKF